MLNTYFYILFGLIALSALVLLLRHFYNKKQAFKRPDNSAIIKGITSIESNLVTSTFIRINALYSHIIKDLAMQDYALLKKNQKRLKKLEYDLNELRETVFHDIITSTEDKKITQFYVLTIENMEDMVRTLDQILELSKSHIYKNRKTLTFNQIKDLKAIDAKTSRILAHLELNLNEQNFTEFDIQSKESEDLLRTMEQMLSQHIDRIRSTDYNPKNFKLYTKLLRESISLITQLNKILYRFKEA